MIQPDLFYDNERSLIDGNCVDISTLYVDTKPVGLQREQMQRAFDFLGTLPEGLFYIFKTGGYHRDREKYPNNDFPYIFSTRKEKVLNVHNTRNRVYPSVDIVIPQELRGETRPIYSFSIHRLVAAAFVKNPDPTHFHFVDHINNDTHDYRVNNLDWVTPSENQLRRYKRNTENG